MSSSKDVFSFPITNNKTLNKEIITPHKISMIILIREQCTLKEKDSVDASLADGTKGRTPFVHFSSLYNRGFCMLLLKLIQSPDMDYKSLKDILDGNNPNYKISPVLSEMFEEQVDELLKEGVWFLLDLIGNASRYIGTAVGQITKWSVLGLFLRRVLLHFDKLPFSQVVQLYKQFEIYVDPSKNSFREEDNPGKWSRKQAELFFARQAARLLSEDPAPLQTQISQLLHTNPDYAEAHFLSFLNCVRSKEFCGAKTSLHHCFDRASLPLDKPTATNNTNNNVIQLEDRSFRYAILSLSAMHATFGHVEEAANALKEAIKLAHNAGDSICLQHSLSWLYTLTSENKEALIERSMAKCTELGLSYLMSLSVQSYAKYCGLTGGRPSVVFDVLMRSDVLNCQHMLSELAANSYCLKSALWALYGQSNMMSLYSQQLLRLNSQQPQACLALCNVARTLANQGDYDYSFAILCEARERFPKNEAAAWMSGFQEILFMFSANESKYNEAMKAAYLLAPVRPWESVLRRAWLHHWQGDDKKSMELSQSILEHCREGWYADPELPPLKVRALIAASETLSSGEALGCLFHALALAQTYYLHQLAAFITLHIANIQLNICFPNRALNLTEASLPTVLSHSSAQEKGRALLLLARCRLASSNDNRLNNLQQTVSILTLSQDLLKKAKDFVRVKHCFYLKGDSGVNGAGMKESCRIVRMDAAAAVVAAETSSKVIFDLNQFVSVFLSNCHILNSLKKEAVNLARLRCSRREVEKFQLPDAMFEFANLITNRWILFDAEHFEVDKAQADQEIDSQINYPEIAIFVMISSVAACGDRDFVEGTKCGKLWLNISHNNYLACRKRLKSAMRGGVGEF